MSGATTTSLGRHRVRAGRTLLGLVLALAMLAAACGGDDDDDGGGTATGQSSDTTSDASGEPWTLRVFVKGAISNLDPQADPGIWNLAVNVGNVAENLVDFAPTAEVEVIGVLAESWEEVDERTVRLHLREGVTFSNGEPWDADAALYNFDRLMGDDTPARHIGRIKGDFESIEKVDDYTVDLVLKAPPSEFLPRLTVFPMVPPEYTETGPDALNEMPIGTGPYVVSERTESRVVLEKNADWWGGEPDGPDQVIIEPRDEDSARVAALSAGEVDLITNVPPDLVGEVANPRVLAPERMITLVLNSVIGITTDPRVREAIVLSVDKTGIREGLIPDYSIQGNCQFGVEGVIGYHPDLEVQPQDLDRARELIEEAGMVGEKITLLVTPGQQVTIGDMAEVAAQQISESGLDVTVESVDFNRFTEFFSGPKEGRPEILANAAGIETKVISQTWGLWLRDSAPSSLFPFDDVPEMTDALAELDATFEPTEREAALRRVAEVACESNAFVFLYAPNIISGVADGIDVPLWPDSRMRYVEFSQD